MKKNNYIGRIIEFFNRKSVTVISEEKAEEDYTCSVCGYHSVADDGSCPGCEGSITIEHYEEEYIDYCKVIEWDTDQFSSFVELSKDEKILCELDNGYTVKYSIFKDDFFDKKRMRIFIYKNENLTEQTCIDMPIFLGSYYLGFPIEYENLWIKIKISNKEYYHLKSFIYQNEQRKMTKNEAMKLLRLYKLLKKNNLTKVVYDDGSGDDLEVTYTKEKVNMDFYKDVGQWYGNPGNEYRKVSYIFKVGESHCLTINENAFGC
ncbi:hypothetical protein HZI73_26135 (plasmid) [Vallitalea pronyensis]|uniref:Uncharacterized protein n=1 Tax=Vallitalea pronyensis TaxID=1348613 RepID=A0A8J8MQR1_9FIRM|nr:hypothetical protein [Vallitalea pronyensis]QUI25894.1 hypothetical protein HZI73_26135 [Vallitalea pronyensis]